MASGPLKSNTSASTSAARARPHRQTVADQGLYKALHLLVDDDDIHIKSVNYPVSGLFEPVFRVMARLPGSALPPVRQGYTREYFDIFRSRLRTSVNPDIYQYYVQLFLYHPQIEATWTTTLKMANINRIKCREDLKGRKENKVKVYVNEIE